MKGRGSPSLPRFHAAVIGERLGVVVAVGSEAWRPGGMSASLAVYRPGIGVGVIIAPRCRKVGWWCRSRGNNPLTPVAHRRSGSFMPVLSWRISVILAIGYLRVSASNPPYRRRYVRRVRSPCTGGFRRPLSLRLHPRRSGCRSRLGRTDELVPRRAAPEGDIRLGQVLFPSPSPLALAPVLADRHLRTSHAPRGVAGILLPMRLRDVSGRAGNDFNRHHPGQP